MRPKAGLDEKYTIGTDDIIITAKAETKVAMVDSDFKNSIISSNLTELGRSQEIQSLHLI